MMQSFLGELLNILGAIGLVLVSLLFVIFVSILFDTLGGRSDTLKFIKKILNLLTQNRFASVEKQNKKRRAVHRYVRYVGPELRKRYGSKKKYTPSQVKQVVKDSGYSTDYDCYAFAMYCSHDDFADYHRTTGEVCDYNSMRSEISDFYNSIFQNDTTFDACDVIDFSDRIDSAKDVGDSSSWWSNMLDSSSGNDFNSDTSYESDFSGGSDFDSGGGDSSSGSD
jgi:hypothetical protein